MKKGDRLTLSPEDQETARKIGTARFENARNLGVLDRKISGIKTPEEDVQSFGAEIAYARMTGGELEDSIACRSSRTGTDRGDVKVGGVWIDVKCTRREDGRLLVPLWKSGSSIERYALMTGVFPSYRYAGSVSARELFIPDRIGDFGYGPTYFISQKELDP